MLFLRGFQCRYSKSSNYNYIAGRPMGYWRSSNENCRVPPSMNAPEILNIRLPKNIISYLYQCFQYSKMNAVSNWISCGKDDSLPICFILSILKDHRIPLGANWFEGYESSSGQLRRYSEIRSSVRTIWIQEGSQTR